MAPTKVIIPKSLKDRNLIKTNPRTNRDIDINNLIITYDNLDLFLLPPIKENILDVNSIILFFQERFSSFSIALTIF